MGKTPKRAKFNNREKVVIKIDPRDYKNEIIAPKIKYEIMATAEHERVFNGMVLPIPTVLLHYLNHMELRVVATIMQETNDNGTCELTIPEIAKRLDLNKGSLYATISSLRKIGLVMESSKEGQDTGMVRKINYEAVQHLNDLVEGEDPGIYGRIRKASRKTCIANMTTEDIENSYDNNVLPPDHDPAEEEEYD